MGDPLADLVTFARIEMESGDLEPWAEMMRALCLEPEEQHWLVKLYNSYDSLGSAWKAWRRWPSPLEWSYAPDGAEAATYPCMQERRNLHAGKLLVHLDSYVTHLSGISQDQWLRSALVGDDPRSDFLRLLAHMRRVWGIGRQAAFEWAEFVAKVCGIPVTAPDAQLWESEGPRRSLQSLYGNDHPTLEWLNARAHECREMLRAEGVDLTWEDFETVICDFHVGRSGRYYPGRHLAALREEIEEVPEPDRAVLMEAFHAVIPEPWCNIAPGIDKSLMTAYRDTGRITTPFKEAA